ncbi:MFS transporter [Sphingomonas sp. Y38-1Y]|uniref:MFS transporter n=1 Tax=Sphingomonas sp. Y38-1Y TaxID=3078265 RepID=UPI0028EEAC30|nr:MFS transporter [Sphingomonas sp. Y38-1Y]
MTTAGYPSPGRALGGILFLSLLGFVLTTDITLTALLSEPMKRDLGLSDLQVALLQGTAYGLALGFASLPAGRLIDRSSRRRLLGFGLVAWAAALVAIGAARDFPMLIVGRMLLGLVAALVVPAAFSMAADLYPPERRSVSTSLLVVGQALGQGCGVLAGGLAFDMLTRMAAAGEIATAPWRVLYFAAAVIGAILLALLALVREPARQERRELAPDLRAAAGELWAYRRFLVPLLLGLLFAQVTIQAASIWSSPLLIRRGLTPGAFAGWLGAILLAGGIAGALAGGWLAELGRRRSGRGGVLIPAAVMALAVAPASLFPLVGPLTGFGALLALHIFAGAVVATIGVIAVTMVIPNEIRGLALGVNTFAAAVFGAAGAPAIVALLSRALGGEAMLASAFAGICVPAAIASALCLLIAARADASVEA